ncbi:nucleoside 2-deoxyribosyltransferase [Sphingomonas sp. ac-8]|uniref:nucleoside 2-deoxyribosyltransferase n=1 Tax=Sphingomonas sp. ac-8 TaxID=3242977 RepID=UPI003A802E40
MALRLYLAGPDVFLPDAPAVARAKLARCSALGFEGIFPFDVEASPSASGSFEDGVAIYRANLARMRSADAIVANLTPFRGVGADSGTAFELGFFAALDRPIHGYSSAAEDFATRMRVLVGDDGDSVVEDFGHHDNLMLGGAVAAHGQWVTVADGDPAAMAAFDACLAALAGNDGRTRP